MRRSTSIERTASTSDLRSVAARIQAGSEACGCKRAQPVPGLARARRQRIAREDVQHDGRQEDERVAQDDDADVEVEIDEEQRIPEQHREGEERNAKGCVAEPPGIAEAVRDAP